METAIRRYWWVLAVALGMAIGILIWKAPAGPTIMRLLPTAGVVFLAVLCFRDWFRQDRIAFVSVIGPALVVALAAIFAVPPWWSLAGAIPPAFLAVFIFDTPVRVWWWQHVLRRPLPTDAQTSDYRLGVALKAWSDELRGQDAPSERRLAAAETALRRLREVDVPHPEWAALRDAYAEVCERRMAAARDGMSPEIEERLQREFTLLDTRSQQLRVRA